MDCKRFLILEQLYNNDGALFEKDLYDMYNAYIEAQRINDTVEPESYANHFDYRLRQMQKEGLVQLVKTGRNRVFVILTFHGCDEYRKNKDEKMYRRILRRRFEGEITLWSLGYRETVETTSLPTEDVKRCLENKLRRLIFESRKNEFSGIDVTTVRQQIEKISEWATDRNINLDLKRCHDKAERQYERWLQLDRSRSFVRAKIIGECYFCGYKCTRTEAAQEKQLLEKYTGQTAAIVCCSCFAHLRWVEKNLTGV